jgi:hypothetical protein
VSGLAPILVEKASLEAYLSAKANLRAGQEQDLSCLAEKVKPGALLDYDGDLFTVASGFIGTHAAYASVHYVRVLESLKDDECSVSVTLQTGGLLMARLVTPAPSCPDTPWTA